jgi:hypothetical protein
MGVGYVDRSLLQSNYQNAGDIYDDNKTEGALKVLADQNDSNWDYITGLVANGTLSPYPAFLSRQALINGNFDVWQRYPTGSKALTLDFNNFVADRWVDYIQSDTTTWGTVTVSRFSLNPGDLPGSFYAHQKNFSQAVSPTAAAQSFSSEKIENGTRYLCGNGKKVTVSFWAKSDLAGKRLGVCSFQNYGSGGSPSAVELLAGQSVTLTSSWAKYSVTIPTNTLAGKVFGTNNDDYLELRFQDVWGTNYTNRFSGVVTSEGVGAAGNVYIAQIQVNAGDQALPFQPRSFAEELALSQRYYEKSYNYLHAPGAAVTNGLYNSILLSANYTAGQRLVVGSNIRFKVSKRTAPTMTFYGDSGTLGIWWSVAFGGNITIGTTFPGTESCTVTTVNAVNVASNGEMYGHWIADAEL